MGDDPLKVTLPAMPFDVPPKPKEVTAAAPAYALWVTDVDPDLIEDDTDAPVADVIDAEGVRWGPRRDWGKV